MPRQSKASAGTAQLGLFNVEDYLKTAPCVPLLRQKVDEWRGKGYPGATEVTRDLLRWWFQTDHRLPNGRIFAYHSSQREAIETLIYVYEVAKVRTRRDLLTEFARQSGEIRLPPDDDFARYCTKMATGSGKTKVMSLAVAWQYWNAVMGGNEQEYAKTFLLLAPNVIVLERLKTDFAGGHIFQADPVMPEHLRYLWDLDCVMRGDGQRAHSEGLLLLTNIQQLYERPDKGNGEEPEPLAAVLGPKGPAAQSESADFIERIRKRGGPMLVINDEAHHTHDEDNGWNEVIHRLSEDTPIAAQLDFSATPRFQKGALFPWTISDYPLKQAIIDGVVKRPYKGVADIHETPSEYASIKYEGYLVAGVHRWREYREQLAGVGKRPLLFIMLNSTDEADDVGEFLRAKFPEDFAGDRTLVIHTKSNGDIKEKDLDRARKVAREVDEADCPVNAIVSVLMLREGWDVQNVTVVVGLRPYTAKANILPEQTIGRGLRLMFRGQGVGYTERVDIIGNRAFLDFVEDLEKLEQLELGKFEVGKDKLTILTIQPATEKAAFNIAIPKLTPVLQRKKSLSEEIAALDVNRFMCPPLPKKPGDAAEQTFHYEGYDFITLEREFSREYTLPPPGTANEVIGYYARLIAKDLKLPAQFAALVPKVREFFAEKAFGEPVHLDEPQIIQAMARPAVAFVVKKLFTNALRSQIVEELEPQLLTDARTLADCAPFPFSNPNAVEGHKCILNYAPCSNDFERAFGRFLDGAGDIVAWCKIPDSFGFTIEYTDQSASLRYYYPDFVGITADGTHWVIETKGMESVEVAYKDKAARLWCDNATELTGVRWEYIKVPQKDFYAMQPADFGDITLMR
ncbi:MAG: Type III restriction-modification enzyme helicase subunit [Ktedonobacterales bacterium]|jgi:type III restriction enzyme|nr:MAG: Type III restriction-modification enzyme helicase subunit [Ktedonobacterales bacterium]